MQSLDSTHTICDVNSDHLMYLVQWKLWKVCSFLFYFLFVCFLTAVQFSDKMMKRLQVRLQQLYPRARLEAFFSEPWTILLCTSSPAEQPVLVIRRCSGEFPTAWILHIRLHSHCALTSLAFKKFCVITFFICLWFRCILLHVSVFCESQAW